MLVTLVRELTRQIEVVLVFLVQHRSRDVRNVSSGVTFTCYIDLEFLDTKDVLEVFEEAKEVFRNFFFRRRRHVSEGKACANRLFDPGRLSATFLPTISHGT
jgi:hypothetical protein